MVDVKWELRSKKLRLEKMPIKRHPSKQTKKQKPNQLKSYLKYSGLAMQMGSDRSMKSARPRFSA